MTSDSDAPKTTEECPDWWPAQTTASIVRLSRGLGHEFNNLMQTNIGALELIRKLTEMGRAAETTPFFASALRAAQSAVAINQQLVSLARPYRPNPQTVDLNVLVAGIIDLLRHSLPKSVVLSTELAPDLWPTRCDPHGAQLALLDFFFAILDATPGSQNLAVATRNRQFDDRDVPSRDLRPGRYVCVEATSADDETGRTSRGGVDGVDTVGPFARANGGAATLEREDGRPTVARFYLPLFDASDTMAASI